MSSFVKNGACCYFVEHRNRNIAEQIKIEFVIVTSTSLLKCSLLSLLLLLLCGSGRDGG